VSDEDRKEPDALHDSNYNLVLPFDIEGLSEEEEKQFVRGFEAGTIYYPLRECQQSGHEYCLDEGMSHDFTVGERNVEMLLRMAEATGHIVKAERSVEDWLTAKFMYDPAQEAGHEHA
jgi:hypothetical protein